MDVGRQHIGEPTQVRDEDRVRKAMEVVEDDHYFGEIAQLCLECFEQGCSQSSSMQRRQSGKVTEIGIDAAEAAKEPLGEPHWIVVVDADFQPDKGQLRVRGGPLGEEHRLSRSSRRNDQSQWADERFVQPTSQGDSVD
jgi:hypothetical protein